MERENTVQRKINKLSSTNCQRCTRDGGKGGRWDCLGEVKKKNVKTILIFTWELLKNNVFTQGGWVDPTLSKIISTLQDKIKTKKKTEDHQESFTDCSYKRQKMEFFRDKGWSHQQSLRYVSCVGQLVLRRKKQSDVWTSQTHYCLSNDQYWKIIADSISIHKHDHIFYTLF